MDIIFIVIATFIIVIFVLTLTVLYLLYSYRRLLEKNNEVSVRDAKKELKTKINFDTDKFVREKVEEAIGLSVHEASETISKNANEVAKSMRKKTIEELAKDEKGDQAAVAAEFDQAKKEISDFKASQMEEVRKKANEILVKIMPQILTKTLDNESQEKLIMEELSNAKRSNIL